MKQFEFDHKHRRWDCYRAFYVDRGPFTEFETGEVMVRYRPRPDGRRVYSRYGVQLVTSSDRDCPELFFDKELTQPVRTAWLAHKGQQHLAVDLEQGVAVALGNFGWRRYQHISRTVVERHPELRFLPSHVQSAAVVWAGPHRLPIPLASIVVRRPDTELKARLRPKLADVRAALCASARIQNLSAPDWNYAALPVDPKWVDWTTDEICAAVCTCKYDHALAAHNGFEYPRTTEKFDMLYTRTAA